MELGNRSIYFFSSLLQGRHKSIHPTIMSVRTYLFAVRHRDPTKTWIIKRRLAECQTHFKLQPLGRTGL